MGKVFELSLRITLLFWTFFYFLTNIAFAKEKIFEDSAIISSNKVKDNRGKRLEQFLKSYNSPLSPYSNFIIEVADRYSLDWKLLVAISGVESSFGRNIPFNSFNAYGWNSGKFYFKDWEDGIETISKALKENYIDKGAKTVDQIGRVYASSPFWSQKVSYFIKEIENFDPLFSLQFSL